MIYDPERNVFRPGKPDSILPHVMWHITDVCPLRCPYCFSPKTEQTLLTESIDHTLAVLRRLGVQKIDIGGGEPLVYPYLPKLIEKIRSQNLFCTLTTSGIGQKNNLDLLTSLMPSITRLIISLDAYGEAHNRLRRNINTWKSVNNIVLQLKEKTRQRQLRINTVATNSMEFESTFEQLANWVIQSGAREWCLIQPHPANQKSNYTDYHLSEQQFNTIIQHASSILAPSTELITRKSKLYNDYWVLHPSGYLQKHTTGTDNGIGLNVASSPIEDIITMISSSSTSVPLEEK